MKILLIGYGKMGKAIERIARERGHEINIAQRHPAESNIPFPPADVAIEFTQPASAVDNIRGCIGAGIPVVCGTTGWHERKEEVENYCQTNHGTLFYASNFSLGVNVFFQLNEYLAKLMERQQGYEVHIEETHHTAKKDAPSGTAITLAEGLLKYSSTKKGWSTPDEKNKNSIEIKSFRVDPAPGTHVIKYESAVDDIEIRHTAHSREGFAIGAVVVAEWLAGKKGVFTMGDFLKF